MNPLPPPTGAPLVLPLWKGQPPNQRASNKREYIDAFGDREIICDVQIPTIEVRLPSSPAEPTSAAIICPGGGYQCLAYNWEGVAMANHLNAQGIAAVILKYRLPDPLSCVTPHLTPMLDAERALRLTRHFANAWRINPKKIGIIGFSAGGHLAAMAATCFTSERNEVEDPIERLSSRPDFQALIYPVISMLDERSEMNSVKRLLGEKPSLELRKRYSAERQIPSDAPPCFLLHAGDDQTVPIRNSILYYQALDKVGIATEMHVYPKGGHGFSLALDKGRLSSWPELLVRWIQECGPQEVNEP